MQEKSTHYWKRLKERPLAYNLVKIGGVILAMAIVAHILMQIGTRHGARRTVPDFAGIPFEEAVQEAREHNLQLQINDSLYVPTFEGGIVLDQLPQKGVEVKPGRTVYITINSYRQKMVPVPYVAGRSLRQAKNMLEIAGLEVGELIYRADMATNYVLEEYFNGKPIRSSTRLEAEVGSGITLYVGVQGGYGTTVVPRLTGLSLKDAKSRLWDQGLNVGKISFDADINRLNQRDARVYMQDPIGERSAAYGAKVNISLTLDTKKLDEHRTKSEKLTRQAALERIAEEKARADSLATAGIDPATEQNTNNDSFFE